MTERYFIRCIGGNLPATGITATKDGVPRILTHPASLDRDFFRSMAAARKEMQRLSDAFAGSSFKFFINAFMTNHQEK